MQFAWSGDRTPLPTPEEIQAAYQQNFTAMMPIGIRYRLTQTEGIGLVERDRRFLWEQEALMNAKPEELSAPGVTIDYLRLLVKSASQRHADLSWLLKPDVIERRLHEAVVRYFYFWTDQKSYHLRFPNKKSDDNISLQAGRMTPNNLMDSYQKVQIISWSRLNAPPLRFWLGTQNNPIGPAGRVGDSVLEKMDSGSSFGPVGFINEEWARRYSWSEMDVFMAIDSNRCKVIGTGDLNGRSLLIVDAFPKGWSDNPQ
ncbi:MAG: hypothetical protein ACRD2U_02935, partial [Terriglobales bacterium]